ncbi:MAG: AmmeMemoRadiSam system protein A, partial [Actinomycetes bacterium]
ERSANTDDSPQFTDEQRRVLLRLAVDAMAQTLRTGHRRPPRNADLQPWLRVPAATFVTLRRGDQLLGCMGTLDPYQSLASDVVEHSLNAAFDDPRMPAIDWDDFAHMTVEISVLGPMHPLVVGNRQELLRRLRPHIDGLVVRAGARRATFLPAVWDSVGSVDDFVALLWRKAGLAPDQWPPTIELFTYRACAFEAPATAEGLAGALA